MAIWIDLVNDIAESIDFGYTKIDYFVEFSSEHSLHFVKLVLVHHLWEWKLCKLEIITWAPEELLLSEFLMAKIVDSKSDEIVGDHT